MVCWAGVGVGVGVGLEGEEGEGEGEGGVRKGQMSIWGRVVVARVGDIL